MAILSASEFKASREAVEAGVNNISDPDAESAIRKAEAKLNLALGYPVFTEDTEITLTSQDGDILVVPQRIRTLTGVTDTFPNGSPTTVTSYALRSNGFRLYRSAGWSQDNTVTLTGTFGYVDGDDKFEVAKEFVTLYAVRYLQNTGPTNGMPAPVGGSYLRGYSTDGAAFDFFTPDGKTTGYADLDRLIDLIGRHPDKGKGLYTISTGGGTRDLGPEKVWLGLETLDDQ